MLSLPWEGGSWVLCWIVLNPTTPSPSPSKIWVKTAAAESSSALAGTEISVGSKESDLRRWCQLGRPCARKSKNSKWGCEGTSSPLAFFGNSVVFPYLSGRKSQITNLILRHTNTNEIWECSKILEMKIGPLLARQSHHCILLATFVTVSIVHIVGLQVAANANYQGVRSCMMDVRICLMR